MTTLGAFLPPSETVVSMVVQNGVLIIATQRTLWAVWPADEKGEAATLVEVEFRERPQ